MDKKYIIAGVLLVITAIIGIVMVYPKYQELSASAKDLAGRQAEFSRMNQTVVAVTQIFDSYKKASQSVGRVGYLLPGMDAQSIPKLFVEMEGLASQSGLFLKTISFAREIANAPLKPSAQAEEKQKGYNIINIDLSMEGSYASLKQFGDAIENNEHLMDVTAFDISGAAQSSDKIDAPADAPASEAKTPASSNFAATITIKAYYQ